MYRCIRFTSLCSTCTVQCSGTISATAIQLPLQVGQLAKLVDRSPYKNLRLTHFWAVYAVQCTQCSVRSVRLLNKKVLGNIPSDVGAPSMICSVLSTAFFSDVTVMFTFRRALSYVRASVPAMKYGLLQ